MSTYVQFLHINGKIKIVRCDHCFLEQRGSRLTVTYVIEVVVFVNAASPDTDHILIACYHQLEPVPVS